MWKPDRKASSQKLSRRKGIGSLGIVLILFISFPARAQERKGTWELGMFLGLQQFGIEAPVTIGPLLRDTIEIETDFTLGTRVGYNVTNHFMVEVVWGTTISPPTATASVRS